MTRGRRRSERNGRFLDMLLRSPYVLVAGKAASHCATRTALFDDPAAQLLCWLASDCFSSRFAKSAPCPVAAAT